MKKFYSLVCALAFGACAMSASLLDATFTTSGQMDGWEIQNKATGEISDGHLNVQMALVNEEKGLYRADLQWGSNQNTTEITEITEGFIAIKFIGTRPNGNLKLVIRNAEGVEKTFNSPSGTVSTPGGNNIYYFDMAKQEVALPFAATRISIVIADCKEAPYSYSIDWIKAFGNVAAIEAAATLVDDGDAEKDVNDVEKVFVTNETTGATFKTLADAWNAAVTEDVLVLNEDVTVTERLNTNSRVITIKGNGHTVTRATNGILFLTIAGKDADGNTIDGPNMITLENLTINGASQEVNAQTIEAGNWGKVVLSDVKFVDNTTTHNMGIISVKGGGSLDAENVEFAGTSVPEGYGFIFGGTNGITLKGDCTCSVFLEGAYHVTDAGMTAGLVTMLFNVDKDAFNRSLPLGDSSMVEGTESTDRFTCGVAGYKLVGKDGGLYIEEGSTAIADVEAAEAAVVTVYNLQGIVVRANVAAEDALAELPQGVYIVGGKKVLVK